MSIKVTVYEHFTCGSKQTKGNIDTNRLYIEQIHIENDFAQFQKCFSLLQNFPFINICQPNGVVSANVRMWCIVTLSTQLIYVCAWNVGYIVIFVTIKFVFFMRTCAETQYCGKMIRNPCSFLVVCDDKSKFILLSQLELYQQRMDWIEMNGKRSQHTYTHTKWSDLISIINDVCKPVCRIPLSASDHKLEYIESLQKRDANEKKIEQNQTANIF